MAITIKDLEKYRKELEGLRNDLVKAITRTSAEVKKPDEATGYSQHQADQGTDDLDRRINLEITSEELRVLRQIERSLEKIQEGTYGVCDITGDSIPKARLDVMPYANTTVKAQEMLEKGLL